MRLRFFEKTFEARAVIINVIIITVGLVALKGIVSIDFRNIKNICLYSIDL